MKIKNVAHIGLCVKDMEAQIKFYTEVMGFEVFDGPTEPIHDEEESRGMGFDDCIDRICLLKAPSGDIFEFIQFIEPDPIAPVKDMNLVGKHHIAFEVDDIFEVVGLFRERGLEVMADPQIAPDVEIPYYYVICRDPEGTAIEFSQYIQE